MRECVHQTKDIGVGEQHLHELFYAIIRCFVPKRLSACCVRALPRSFWQLPVLTVVVALLTELRVAHPFHARRLSSASVGHIMSFSWDISSLHVVLIGVDPTQPQHVPSERSEVEGLLRQQGARQRTQLCFEVCNLACVEREALFTPDCTATLLH